MKIPIDREYVFTVKVLEDDSFNPQDLTDMTAASFSVYTEDGNHEFTIDTEGDVAGADHGYWTTSGDVLKTVTTEVETLDGSRVQIDYSLSTITTPGVEADLGTTVESTTVEDVRTYVTTTTVVTDSETSALISSNTTGPTEDVDGTAEKDSSVTNINTALDTATGQTTTTTETISGVLVSAETTTTTTVGVASYTGIITFTVKSGERIGTSLLTETNGPVEDNYYVKSGYRGSIIAEFDSRPDINVLIENITAIKV